MVGWIYDDGTLCIGEGNYSVFSLSLMNESWRNALIVLSANFWLILLFYYLCLNTSMIHS